MLTPSSLLFISSLRRTKAGGSKRRRDSTGGAATPTPAAATPAPAVVEGGGKGSSDAYYLCYVRKGTVFPKETELLPPQEVLVRQAHHTLHAIRSSLGSA
jgi:hypothetical protein